MSVVSGGGELNDEQLRALYAWIDAIPLSRPKRNIARDFSDGVMLAEVIAAYFPAFVELHNYSAAHSVQQKLYNFDTLNQRVLKKLGFQIPRPVIEDIVNCRPGAIENVLNALQYKMAKYREKMQKRGGGGGGSVGGGGSKVESKRPAAAAENRPSSTRQPQNENNRPAPSNKGRGGNMNGGVGGGAGQVNVDQDILLEKEQQIRELQETVEILELKVAKLEQVREPQ